MLRKFLFNFCDNERYFLPTYLENNINATLKSSSDLFMGW